MKEALKEAEVAAQSGELPIGAIVMSNISHVVFVLPDNWVKPREMLNMDYVRRHIAEYVGGVLAEDSLKLFRQTRPQDIPLLLEGKRED